MSTAWMLYWWTRLDSISEFFGMVTVLLIVAAIPFGIWMFVSIPDNEEEDKLKAISGLKYTLGSALLLMFISIWVPSQKDLAIIVGGQVATNIVNSPESKELGDKALQLINSEIDKRIADNANEKP